MSYGRLVHWRPRTRWSRAKMMGAKAGVQAFISSAVLEVKVGGLGSQEVETPNPQRQLKLPNLHRIHIK